MSSSPRWGRCLIYPHFHPQSRQVSSSALGRGRGRRESGQSAGASTTPFVRAIHTSSTSAAVEGVLPKRKEERNGPPPIAPPPTPPPRTSSCSKLKARTIPTRSQSHVKDVSRITGAHVDDPVGELYYEMDVSDAVHGIPYDDLVSALHATRKTPLVDEQDLSEEGVPGIEELFEDGQASLRGGAEESLDWQVLLDELATRDHREGSKVETTKAKAREIEKPEIVPAPKPTTTTTTTSSSMQLKPSSSTSQTSEPVSTPIPASTRAPIVKAIPAIITPTKRLAPLGKARDLDPSPRPIGILPYTPPSNVPPTDPSSRPLLSRYDWRLSSPLPRQSPSLIPPPLDIPTSNLQQGANKLVGVGQAPYFSGRRIKEVEGWGWKGRVPQGEKGTWRAADRHRVKLDRLLDLTEEAEEKSYLETLARSGTPEQRETLGRTVCRAQGMWLTKSKRTDEILKMREEKDELRRKSAGGGGVISTWRNCEGGDLDEANGYKFVPGTILRFTPLKSENVGSGPAPPPSHAPKHPQGSVLEVQNGRLIVIFAEADMWVLGQEEYRIDVGVDDASYHLQRAAIDSLYFDSARQRLRNERAWQAAHMTFARTKICSTVREWTLQGTDVRELIVPTEATPAVEVVHNPAEFLFDDLIDGRNESAIVPASMTQVEETTPRPASNPSPLLCDNQLINSWVKRHQCSPPLAMEGDPILRLNDSQTRAVAMAMSESLSLIQGPPGTGKSATLVTLIHLLKTHFRIPQPILLCAPTHVSIDHLLSLLIDAGLNPLRMGKAHKVREELREWTVERRREGHPLWDLCEGARVECERIREELDGLRETVGVDKKGLERIMEMEEIFKNEWRRFVTLEQRLYSSLLATADVFCSTTIGAGATKIMSMIDFPIVFLDEAAMCTEPVSLIPLMKGAQHVCFIGDQKQLSAVVKSREAVQNRLHVSLFERLMAEKAVQTALLDTQYRMRPQISAFPNQAFYNSALKDAPNVSKRSSPPKSTYLQMNAETGKPDPCVFISHEGAETFFRQSTLNETEVDLIVSIVGDLLTRNPELDASTIGIISPYASQMRLLSNTFSIRDRRGFSSRVIDRWGFDIALRASQVEVNTVDGYQGREKSIIILSTVRSNPANFIGFLSDRRRLNVALTRAKDLLFVVGNERTLGFARSGWGERGEDEGNGGTGVWKGFLAWYRARGWIKQWGASGGKGQ